LTTQLLKEKVQKDKQRSTNHTLKTIDRVTRTPLRSAVNSGAPERQAVPALLVAILLPYFTTTYFDESFKRMLLYE
jgi:hypothetical protein